MNGDDSDDNLVKLTAEEHYVAHQLLVKMYPENRKLIYAANMMTRSSPTTPRTHNKQYGWLRRKFAKTHSEMMKGKKYPPRTKEHTEKLRRSLIASGKARRPNPKNSHPLSEEHKLAISRGGKGTTRPPRNDAWREKQRMVQSKTYTCPHCKLTGKGSAMKRWHFDNCRLK